jgi:hypothetical protein
MRLILCKLLGIHCAPPGVDERFSIYFCCYRCRDVVPGGLGKAAR